jgi:hypothetical protein
MQKITHAKAMLYVSYGMTKDLFIGACIWGTVIYFVLMFIGDDISYSRCFASIVLLRSLYMGIMCYMKKDDISQAIDKAVEEFNKGV